MLTRVDKFIGEEYKQKLDILMNTITKLVSNYIYDNCTRWRIKHAYNTDSQYVHSRRIWSIENHKAGLRRITTLPRNNAWKSQRNASHHQQLYKSRLCEQYQKNSRMSIRDESIKSTPAVIGPEFNKFGKENNILRDIVLKKILAQNLY